MPTISSAPTKNDSWLAPYREPWPLNPTVHTNRGVRPTEFAAAMDEALHIVFSTLFAGRDSDTA